MITIHDSAVAAPPSPRRRQTASNGNEVRASSPPLNGGGGAPFCDRTMARSFVARSLLPLLVASVLQARQRQ